MCKQAAKGHGQWDRKRAPLELETAVLNPGFVDDRHLPIQGNVNGQSQRIDQFLNEFPK
jgi:hypothetical protein